MGCYWSRRGVEGQRRYTRLNESEPVALQQQHSETEQLNQTEQALRAEIAQLQEKIADLTKRLAVEESEVATLQKALSAAEEGRSQAEGALAQLRKQHEELTKRIPDKGDGSKDESSTPKVTLKGLVSELQEVATKWRFFGLFLNIPWAELDIISSRVDLRDDAGKMTEMLHRWMQLNENPSWSDIVAALVKLKVQPFLARRLAKKYGVLLSTEDSTHLPDNEVDNLHQAIRRLEEEQQRVTPLIEWKNSVEGQLRQQETEVHFLHELPTQYKKNNQELRKTIEDKEDKIRHLKEFLRHLKSELHNVREGVKRMRAQLQQASSELKASCARVQKPESQREGVELDQRIRELLTRVEELERASSITWRTCQKAPVPLQRGSAAVDAKRKIAYFSLVCHVYAYEWLTHQWSRMPDLPNSITYSTLAVTNDRLMAIGGQTVSGVVGTMFSLEGEGKWKIFSQMPTKRSSTAVVCSGDYLVVIGGRGMLGRLMTVEVLNTSTLPPEWLTACSLSQPLSCATATVVEDNIYLVGSSDINNQTKSVYTCSLTALLKQPSAEPQTQLWRKVADTPVYQSTSVAFTGKLVAIGGCEYDHDQTPTNAVYAYDPKEDSWNLFSHMNTFRRLCLAVVLPQTGLMVVGGCVSGSDDVSSCEDVEIAEI